MKYFLIFIAFVSFATLINSQTFVQKALHIIGGILAVIRQVPYQCSLWNGTRHFCGCALLSNEWAITAAHCMGKMGPYKVRVNSSTSNSGGTLVDVIADHKHPYFNEAYSFDYDVALINLKKFDSTGIQFANWPGCNDKKCISEVGNMIVVSGWGRTNLSTPDISITLQKVSLPIVDREQCKTIYKSDTEVTPRMFCCGYLQEGGKDSCDGDSGGPATCEGDLVGVVSAGTEYCAQPGKPGLYTDLLDVNIQEWIQQKSGLSRNCTTTTSNSTAPSSTSTPVAPNNTAGSQTENSPTTTIAPKPEPTPAPAAPPTYRRRRNRYY